MKRAVVDCKGFWKNDTDDNALYSVFTACGNLTSAEINCRELTGGGYYLRRWFWRSGSLSSVSFPNLSVVDSKRCFYETFEGCSSLTRLEFPELISCYSSQNTQEGVFSKALSGCRSLTSISFPKLTAMENTVFKPTWPNFDPWNYGMLDGVSSLKEIHFAPGTSSIITSLYGWSSRWGASNSSDISVWCGNDMIYPTSSPSEPEPDYTTDTDGDGLPDWDEVNSYNTDPNSTDTDQDGYDDY